MAWTVNIIHSSVANLVWIRGPHERAVESTRDFDRLFEVMQLEMNNPLLN